MKDKSEQLADKRILQLEKELAVKKKALEIETSLEKVRVVALSMKEPAHMLKICKTVSLQLQKLGVNEIRNVQTAIFYPEKGTYMNYEYYAKHDKTIITETSCYNNKIHKAFAIKMQKGKGQLFISHIKGAKVKDWIAYQKTTNVFIDKYLQTASSLNYYWYSLGPVALGISTYEPLSNEDQNLFKRFLHVFELAYRRYLDIEKAEEQAREARIQLALERVRGRTMAMQKSDELSEAANLLFQQVQALGMPTWSAGYCIWDDNMKAITLSMSRPFGDIQPSFRAPLDEDPVFMHFLEAHNKGEELFIEELSGEAIVQNYKYLHTLPVVGEQLDAIVKAGHPLPTYQVNHCAYFSKGFLLFITYEQVPESHDIFRRFAKVFDQTYTRFLDLQKAEANAREARIEASLERVRSSTMAMHKSEDLPQTAAVLFEQLRELGNTPDRISIGIFHEAEGIADMWLTDQSGNEIHSRFVLDLNEKTTVQKLIKGWKAGVKSMTVDLTDDELKRWLKYVREIGLVVKDEHFKNRRVHNVAFFSHGWLNISTLEPLSNDMINILERFATVYSLTYRRFLDLQQAEEQAREAQIEAALERVRAKAMGMQNSNDLSIAASMVFTELRKLGINPIRCGVGLLNKESTKAQLYSAVSSAEGDSLALVGWVILQGHPVLQQIYERWLAGEDYFPELSGRQLKSYYEKLSAGLTLPVVPHFEKDEKQYGHFLFSFSVGCLYAWSDKPYNEAELKILRRFASIIDLTFRRYMELQKSEANAREAVKQAALDRIRADIASMRTISDLDRITPLIWNELNILGIPFIRCGVFIMDNEQQLIHTFLSTPDGKAIAAFQLPFNSPGKMEPALNHWKLGENYIDHWDEKTFTEFADSLVNEGALPSSDQYMQTFPEHGFYLHFLPFLQGMLYVGNETKLGPEELDLIQSVADAFSTAYARYEDFNKLEAAKKQVDFALNELQATQKQLIQSEKMASLGELTAGIAHEIQNPLNFVNNFSEVNKEMLEELQAERLKPKAERDESLEDELINDVIDNEQKINHHGKRADAIVKGMLQHSRASTGNKEPTDINALCDEYLRLSYHGLRAKDKSFNVVIKTDFDPTVGKINIIPQDIGRVLLNLYNNAFYACTERSRSAVKEQKSENLISYQPTVSVSTKKSENSVIITVSDNGNGIPQKIVDKIFQPFFTTKPTGEGTGLGLSLSYDIVKAHGGEVKVESEEGKGTEFIIDLPY